MGKTEPVTLSNTREHILFSKIMNDSFSVRIALPKKYRKDQKYPVVYLTDANILFGMVSETAWLLQFGKEICEIIIVAIGYPDDGDHLTLRKRDLLPTAGGDDKVKTGRAGDFLDFISTELIPFVEDNYSVDTENSTLAGDSFGGLFALFVLFNKPQLFQRYIIGSPSIYWDNSVILKHERIYSENFGDLTARVFLSVGELEAIYEPEHAGMLSNAARLIELLSSRNYSNLKLTTHIFQNETHLSVIPATMSRGLREVLGELRIPKGKVK